MDFNIVDAFGVSGLAFLLKKFVDFGKMIQDKDTRGATIQLLVWIGGVALFWLGASSRTFAQIEIAGFAFSDLDAGAKILAGLTLGSTASVVSDRDRTLIGARVPLSTPTAPSAPVVTTEKTV